MQRVNPHDLHAGDRLPGDLFSLGGAKLLARGAVLSPSQCTMLRKQHASGLVLAAEAESSGRHLPTNRPRRERKPLVTKQGMVMALRPVQPAGPPGHPDDDEFDEREMVRKRARRARFADQYTAERSLRWERIPRRIAYAPERLTPRFRRAWPGLHGVSEFRYERAAVLDELFQAMLDHEPIDAEPLYRISDELIDLCAQDPGRFPALAIVSPPAADELAEQAICTSVLCVATAARLGWARIDIQHAAMAGMLADIGMLLVSESSRMSPKPLDEFEINRVFRHPMFGVMLMDSIRGLPETVRFATYQHQERENGSGYPSGARGDRISDMARIVSVCDAMIAASSPRPWRVDRRPHDALMEIVRHANEGVYHRPTVRALIEAVGVFPVGSWVLLSSGDSAVVVSAHKDRSDRPLVSIDGVEHAGHTLSLAARSTRVLRSIDAPHREINDPSAVMEEAEAA